MSRNRADADTVAASDEGGDDPGSDDGDDRAAEDEDDEADAPDDADGEACDGNPGEILDAALAQVPPLEEPAGADWDADALTEIVLTVEDATASSPYLILMFHGGEFLGTPTADPYAYEPLIVRNDDNSKTITYTYPQDGDTNADPTGEAVATVTYDEATGEVEFEGEVPRYLLGSPCSFRGSGVAGLSGPAWLFAPSRP